MSRTNPKNKKSRPYTVDSKVYSFTYTKSGKLLGVTGKGTNGKFNVAEDLNQEKFTTDASNMSTASDTNLYSFKYLERFSLRASGATINFPLLS